MEVATGSASDSYWSQPGLQSKLEDIQSYIEKLCLKKPKNKNKKTKKIMKQNKNQEKAQQGPPSLAF